MRDNYTCYKCIKKGGKLCGHHLDAWSICNEGRFATDNGITLCQKCHIEFHSIYGQKSTREMFREFCPGFI